MFLFLVLIVLSSFEFLFFVFIALSRNEFWESLLRLTLPGFSSQWLLFFSYLALDESFFRIVTFLRFHLVVVSVEFNCVSINRVCLIAMCLLFCAHTRAGRGCRRAAEWAKEVDSLVISISSPFIEQDHFRLFFSLSLSFSLSLCPIRTLRWPMFSVVVSSCVCEYICVL